MAGGGGRTVVDGRGGLETPADGVGFGGADVDFDVDSLNEDDGFEVVVDLTVELVVDEPVFEVLLVVVALGPDIEDPDVDFEGLMDTVPFPSSPWSSKGSID